MVKQKRTAEQDNVAQESCKDPTLVTQLLPHNGRVFRMRSVPEELRFCAFCVRSAFCCSDSGEEGAVTADRNKGGGVSRPPCTARRVLSVTAVLRRQASRLCPVLRRAAVCTASRQVPV